MTIEMARPQPLRSLHFGHEGKKEKMHLFGATSILGLRLNKFGSSPLLATVTYEHLDRKHMRDRGGDERLLRSRQLILDFFKK